VKAAVWRAPGDIEVRDIPDRQPGPGEVRIRVRRCGLCGTDVHIHHGDFIASYPLVGGHELSGEVDAVGEGVSSVRVGDRVAADPVISCGRCHFCRIGRRNHCESFGALGVTVDGGFAEACIAPCAVVYPIGDIPFAAAAMAEPLACVLHGVRRANPAAGSTALVFGAGPIGLLMLQALLRSGVVTAACIEPDAARRALAAELGAAVVGEPGDDVSSPPPHGFDLVVDATGVPSVVEGMLPYAKSGGTVMFFGVCPPDARISLSPFEVYKRDLTIVGSFSLATEFSAALDMLRAGVVSVDPLVSLVAPLDDLPALLEGGLPPSALKVQIEP